MWHNEADGLAAMTTTTLLSNELSSLISDSKRRNTDLRNAAERSLQELKSLPSTSEQQVAAGKPWTELQGDGIDTD